jgi:hypothetical protein
LTIVGYGSGGDAQGSDGSFGTKQVSATPIDEVTATEIIWRFDNADEGNSASGDSGGPGLLDIDGVFYLAAIISSGTDPFSALGDVAFNLRVDAYVDWIDAVVGTFDSGDEPADEPSDEPADEPSDEPDRDPTDEEPDTTDAPTLPVDEDPSEPQPAVEAPLGCKFDFGKFDFGKFGFGKFDFGSLFNGRGPITWKPSRGQAFRRPARRPPSRIASRVGARRTRTPSTARREAVRTGGRRGLSSRSPRRSR